MLKLEKINNEVFYNGIKLKINAQASKGPNNEVVYVADLPEANGQKWISLKKLHEGINELECQGREVTIGKKYVLTPEENQKVAELQAQINEIINNAKSRYVPKTNINDINKLTTEQKLALIKQLEAQLETK